MAHLQEMSLNRRLFFLFFEGRRSSITGVASFGGVGRGGGGLQWRGSTTVDIPEQGWSPEQADQPQLAAKLPLWVCASP